MIFAVRKFSPEEKNRKRGQDLMMKKFFLFCTAIFLLLGNSYGEVKISRLMLKNGSAIRTSQESSAVMECLLENPDAVPHTVELLLHPAEKDFRRRTSIPGRYFFLQKVPSISGETARSGKQKNMSWLYSAIKSVREEIRTMQQV